MAERRGPPAQEANRIRGSSFVKPIVYGNVTKAMGRKRESDGHTHEWILYVRPYHNEDMSQYVKKVEFKLHESYEKDNMKATRVVTKPPYEVKESGWGEFEAIIKIYFVDPAERPVTIYHHLKLFNADPLIVAGKKPLVNEYYDEIVFQEPTLTMYEILKTRVPPVARHDTDFENKRERTIKQLNTARDEVRAELSDLRECLKEAKELSAKFREELSKAEKESTTGGSAAGSLASTPAPSTPVGMLQQETSSSASSMY